MKWSSAHSVVEQLRRDTRLYLPGLSKRRGFSSSRVEHLLNGLVRFMPSSEVYVEVGTLEGRTLEAASVDNGSKRLFGIDPCLKYGEEPDSFFPNVKFIRASWQEVLSSYAFPGPVGLTFYDGCHDEEETALYMKTIEPYLTDEAVLVLDDWDRESVRDGAFQASDNWRLLREMPCYGDGLTVPQQHFGYSFGVAVWGFKR